MSDHERRPDYVRIWADDEGESHFEDVFLELDEVRSPNADSIVAVSAAIAVEGLTFRHVVTEASYETPHHPPGRVLLVVLAGTAEVEVSDGEVRRFGPGSVNLVEDTTGKGHVTRAVGDEPRVTLMARL
jgi:quercetin dioxygenase-like cupin family protein